MILNANLEAHVSLDLQNTFYLMPLDNADSLRGR